MKTLCSTALAAALLAFLPGCTTPPGPNQVGGTAVGAATGALAGAAIGHSGHHTAGGALIGGTIGALAGALVGKEIDEATRTHVVQGQPLTLEDIKALARANVRDDLIIGQINATRTVYRLTTAQILELKNAGVSDAVIDYMINTPTAFAAPPPARAYNYYYVDPTPYPYFVYPPPLFWHPYYGGPRHYRHHR
jgi:hypothetical protein